MWMVWPSRSVTDAVACNWVVAMVENALMPKDSSVNARSNSSPKKEEG